MLEINYHKGESCLTKVLYWGGWGLLGMGAIETLSGYESAWQPWVVGALLIVASQITEMNHRQMPSLLPEVPRFEKKMHPPRKHRRTNISNTPD